MEFLNDENFHLVRLEAEAKAKELLNTKLGTMTPADINKFLHFMNTESIKGKVGFTRFERHFTNINAKQICKYPIEFNDWIDTLWRTEGVELKETMTRFLENSPIKNAGTLFSTFVFYLLIP